jgi:hypothetical protein
VSAPKLYPADWAARMTPGAPYRPSNGTDGELFVQAWCNSCSRWDEGRCEIALDAMAFRTGDADYPAEWVYDGRGQPSCSAWRAPGAVERCDATPDLFS